MAWSVSGVHLVALVTHLLMRKGYDVVLLGPSGLPFSLLQHVEWIFTTGLLMFLLLNLNLSLLLNLMALLGTFLPERHRLTHLYMPILNRARDIAKSKETSRRVTCPSVTAHPPMRSK